MADLERPLNSCRARFRTAFLYSGDRNTSSPGTAAPPLDEGGGRPPPPSPAASSLSATFHRPLTHDARLFSRASATTAKRDSPSKLASISRKTSIWMSGKTAARAARPWLRSRRSGGSGPAGRSCDSSKRYSGPAVADGDASRELRTELLLGAGDGFGRDAAPRSGLLDPSSPEKTISASS